MKHLLLFNLFIFLAACAATTVTGQTHIEEKRATPQPISVPDGAELMVVRPEGNAGIAQIYNLTTNNLLYELPAGRTDVDNTLHFSAEYDGMDTKIAGIQINNGKKVQTYSITDNWHLSGLSPNGKWLALSQEHYGTTTVQILNAGTGKERHTLTLDGKFEVEAISNNGQFLYLIHHLNDENYQVRLYDLNIKELAERPLRDKRIQDAFMTGYAWGTTMSNRGDWLLTLYLNQTRQTAFIHALNLDNSLTFCLALPSAGGDFDTLQQYSMTFTPDGQTIYAANAALGKIVAIRLFEFDQRLVTNFTPVEENAGKQVMQTSLLSPDGTQLYFALDNQIWAYDTQQKSVSEAINTSSIISGMMFSPTQNSLRLATANQTLKTVPFDDFHTLVPLAQK